MLPNYSLLPCAPLRLPFGDVYALFVVTLDYGAVKTAQADLVADHVYQQALDAVQAEAEASDAAWNAAWPQPTAAAPDQPDTHHTPEYAAALPGRMAEIAAFNARRDDLFRAYAAPILARCVSTLAWATKDAETTYGPAPDPHDPATWQQWARPVLEWLITAGFRAAVGDYEGFLLWMKPPPSTTAAATATPRAGSN